MMIPKSSRNATTPAGDRVDKNQYPTGTKGQAPSPRGTRQIKGARINDQKK